MVVATTAQVVPEGPAAESEMRERPGNHEAELSMRTATVARHTEEAVMDATVITAVALRETA